MNRQIGRSPRIFSLLINLLFVGLAIGCTKDNEESGGSVPGPRDPTVRTDCGIVSNGEIVNPVNRRSGDLIDGISFLEPNIYTINVEGEQKLVALYGVRPGSPEVRDKAIQKVIDLAKRSIYFFRPLNSACLVDTTYGRAEAGQLITLSGDSFAEELLAANLVLPELSINTCKEALVSNCYEALTF